MTGAPRLAGGCEISGGDQEGGCGEQSIRGGAQMPSGVAHWLRHTQGGRAFDRAGDSAAFNLPARLGSSLGASCNGYL
jgi:hypothetical protein